MDAICLFDKSLGILQLLSVSVRGGRPIWDPTIIRPSVIQKEKKSVSTANRRER